MTTDDLQLRAEKGIEALEEAALIFGYLPPITGDPADVNGTFDAALREARKASARDERSGKRIDDANHLSSSLGAVGYLIVLDQLGEAVKPNGATEDRAVGSLGRAPHDFAPHISAANREILFALRCCLVRDYSLANLTPERRRHHVVLVSSHVLPLVTAPKRRAAVRRYSSRIPIGRSTARPSSTSARWQTLSRRLLGWHAKLPREGIWTLRRPAVSTSSGALLLSDSRRTRWRSHRIGNPELTPRDHRCPERGVRPRRCVPSLVPEWCRELSRGAHVGSGSSTRSSRRCRSADTRERAQMRLAFVERSGGPKVPGSNPGSPTHRGCSTIATIASSGPRGCVRYGRLSGAGHGKALVRGLPPGNRGSRVATE